MIFDLILLPAGIHWTSKVVFTVSILVYAFNLQFFVREMFQVRNREALIKKTHLKEVAGSFGTNTYDEQNPVDQARANLQVYKKSETLKLQAGSIFFIRS